MTIPRAESTCGPRARPRSGRRMSPVVIVLAAWLGAGLVACSSGSDGGAVTGGSGGGSRASVLPEAEVPAGEGASPCPRAGASDGAAWSPTADRSATFELVVPRPVSVVAGVGSFEVGDDPVLVVADPLALDAACLLAERLAGSDGTGPEVVDASGAELDGDEGSGDDPADQIVFGTTAASTSTAPGEVGAEGYRLEVTVDGVEVDADGSTGYGWAVATLLQSAGRVPGPSGSSGVAFPVGTVVDEPRFAWRGVMVDIARHFFGPRDIERVIDLMADYKLNVLHLHLSDDQGWRIAVDAYPQLTEVGAATEVGGTPGGFLTKADYRRLVAHAERRGITVVPEIDLPGHTNAALTAVPELNCGPTPEPYTGMAVGFSTLCIGEPAVEEFVRTVLAELAEMTPGPYLHIGGDESHATAPADYRAFVTETLDVVRGLGKVPMGWEEVAGVPPGGELVVQQWLDPLRAVEAVESGSSVVLSPSSRLYFDMAYGPFAPEGNSWAGTIDTPEVYKWDPGAFVPAGPAGAVLGVEAPVWSELVEDPDDLARRLLPRLPALAELAWTAQADRSWDDFARRVAAHESRWAADGLSYTPDPSVPWPDNQDSSG